MDVKNTLPITEVRKNLFNIIDKVERTRTHFTVTENGRPKAIIMSAEEFESLRETLEVMRLAPDLPKRIEKVERDFKTGKYKNYTTLEELLAKEGYVFKDKPSKRYDVSNQTRRKIRKRSR